MLTSDWVTKANYCLSARMLTAVYSSLNEHILLQLDELEACTQAVITACLWSSNLLSHAKSWLNYKLA